jgi:hypothetical protein
MFQKFLKSSGVGNGAAPSVSESVPDGPYRDDATNVLYHLLFCDRPGLFRSNHQGDLRPPWSMLFNPNPEPEAIARIAGDQRHESRVRMLAFNLLRATGKAVAARELLGTIVEVRLSEGLDTLAAFVDGSARYLNHSGRMAVVEGSPNPFTAEIEGLIRASQSIVAAIGPWDRERLPPPKEGNIRLTFLVSDGLSFGEGPMEAMQQDAKAAPLIGAATALLVKLVDETEDG